MHLADKETVHGTMVTIGRRLNHRTRPDGTKVVRTSKTFTAVYTDAEGVRVAEALKTSSLHEARRRAIQIQRRLDEGGPPRRRVSLTIEELTERYMAYNAKRDLAPRTLARYASDCAKLVEYCAESGVDHAARFDENRWHEYGAWLRDRTHVQGSTYAPKSIYTTMTVCKQVFNFGVRQRLLALDPMPGVRLPKARARPQTCPTTDQVETMLDGCEGITHAAIAILAFTGLRLGELQALAWADVRLDMGELGMLHVRRGAATGQTKTRQERFVPIHPRIRTIIEGLPRSGSLVLPGLRQRTLLSHVKRLGKQAGVDGGIKVHSLRHHFASMCANTRIPYRLSMQWLGHSSSQILDLYYHLHDDESQAAMKALAAARKSHRGR